MTKSMTATLKFTLPIEIKYIKDATIIVKDYKSPTMYTITKHMSDCDLGKKSLTVILSAEEMSGFEEHNKAKIQLIVYLPDGTKHADNVFYRTVKELLDEEAI